MTPKESFFRFVKNHDLFKDIEFSDSPVKDQQIVAVLCASAGDCSVSAEKDSIVIDPDYDEIYNGFLHLDHDKEAIGHIRNLLDNRAKDNKELVAKFIVDHVIRPMINSNIKAKKVYFVLGDGKNWKDLSWANLIMAA